MNVPQTVELLLAADHPVMYAGQGFHYPQARNELQVVTDRLTPPVATSLAARKTIRSHS